MGKHLKVLKIIFLALLLETLVFFVAVLIFKASEGFEFMNVESQIIYVITGIAITGILIASQLISKVLLQKMVEATDRQARISKYLTICIVRWALMEAAMLFSITIMMVTGTWVAAIAFAFLFILFLSFNPSRSRVERELGFEEDVDMRHEL